MKEILNGSQNNSKKSVTVIGTGVAGMSAACALAETGFHVQLVECLLLSQGMNI
jgi:heterodisulfide reductase subunit A-like polyferredoxin